jgi:hypothetical protein
MTRPPSRAMRDAVARPMPETAPVTITVRPSNRLETVRFCHVAVVQAVLGRGGAVLLRTMSSWRTYVLGTDGWPLSSRISSVTA